MIVRATETICLIGGAEFQEDALNRALSLASRIVAADGGADAALAHGLTPEAVIGDFDSISAEARSALPGEAMHLIDDQDTTDFDKCLSMIAAPLILGVGFTGARQDHQLATYNSLVRFPEQRCILIGPREIVLLAPPSLTLDLAEGEPVSLFPMGAVEGFSDGLEWEIGGLNFAPDGRVGTSNRAKGPVHLSLTSPKMLLILPVGNLERVAVALAGNAARWS